MLEVKEIEKMPFHDLLQYHEALKSICDRYERELGPLYNAVLPQDRQRWVEINKNLQEAKKYYDVVFMALKSKTFNNLENYAAPVEKAKMKYNEDIKED